MESVEKKKQEWLYEIQKCKTRIVHMELEKERWENADKQIISDDPEIIKLLDAMNKAMNNDGDIAAKKEYLNWMIEQYEKIK